MKRLIVLLLLLVSSLHGATHYFTQGGAGAHDGSTLGNAWSVAEFNAVALTQDDTYQLNGTVSSQVIPKNGGTSGHPVTIQFATGAKISAAYLPTTGGIYIFALNNVTIDGNGVGIIESTANGTGLANQVDSIGVYAVGSSNLIVKNLTVGPVYVRTRGTEQHGYGTGINNAASNGGMSGYLVYGCTVHDAFLGIGGDYGNTPVSTNYEIRNNTIYNCNWGVTLGDRGGASDSLTTALVHDNTIYNFTNWDDTSVNAFHHNGVFCFANVGTLTGLKVYNNIIGPGFGGSYQTSGVYVNANISGPQVYNNVFVCGTGETVGNGLITISSDLTTTLLVANNTFSASNGGVTAIQTTGSNLGTTQTLIIKNNLGYGTGNAGVFIAVYRSGSFTFSSDYNLNYGFSATQDYIYSTTTSGVFYSFAGWQGLGWDAHGLTSNPLLNGSYGLSAGSPAIGTGTDLSAYFTTDAAGYTRTVPWDIGAYKWLGGGSGLLGALILSGNASIK